MNAALRALPLLLALLFWSACSDKKKEAPPTPTSTSIAGTIRVPEGAEKSGVMVFVEGTGYVAFTDSAGGYTISGIPVGAYKVRASRADLASASVGSVTITTEDLAKPPPSHTLDSVAMSSNSEQLKEAARAAVGEAVGSLKGIVKLPSRIDFSGTVVSLTTTDQRTVTDSAGTWLIRGIPPGSYELEFAHEGFAPTLVKVDVVGGKDTEIPETTMAAIVDAEEMRSVYGQILMTDRNGDPVTTYDIVSVALEGSGQTAYPDANGEFQFAQVAPGRYTLSASAPGYLLEERIDVNLNDVRAFETALALLESPMGDDEFASIRGRVVLEDGGAGASGIIVALAGSGILAFTDSTGAYVLDRVPLGMHEVTATLDGYRTGRLIDVDIDEAAEFKASDIILERKLDRPKVVYTSPGDNERGVTIDDPTIVTIQFDKPMEPGTLRRGVSVEPRVDFTLDLGTGSSGREGLSIMRLNLTGNGTSGRALKYKTAYSVRVSGDVADIDGVTMGEDYTLTFTTGGPKIVDSFPQDGATGIYPYYDLPVKVYFNAPVDQNSISPSDIRISPSAGAVTSVRVRNEPRTGWSTLFIDAKFDYDTEYRVTIRRGVRSVTRDNFENTPYTFSFRTPKATEGSDYYQGIDGSTQDGRYRDRERIRRQAPQTR